MSDGVQYLIRDSRRVGGTPNLRSQGISQVPLPSVMCCNFFHWVETTTVFGGYKVSGRTSVWPIV